MINLFIFSVSFLSVENFLQNTWMDSYNLTLQIRKNIAIFVKDYFQVYTWSYKNPLQRICHEIHSEIGNFTQPLTYNLRQTTGNQKTLTATAHPIIFLCYYYRNIQLQFRTNIRETNMKIISYSHVTYICDNIRRRISKIIPVYPDTCNISVYTL